MARHTEREIGELRSVLERNPINDITDVGTIVLSKAEMNVCESGLIASHKGKPV